MSTISSFKDTENKHDVYSGKDCTKKFCQSLGDDWFQNKKKSEISNKQTARIRSKCKNLEDKYVKDEKYCGVRDHCHYAGEYRGAAHSICNLKYSVPKKIPIVFYNGPNYDHHLLIKETAE